jgi:hypothetical protein
MVERVFDFGDADLSSLIVGDAHMNPTLLRRAVLLIAGGIYAGAAGLLTAAEAERAPAAPDGPEIVAGDFPLAVWLQDPKNAPRYKAIGINVYVGLWQGPTAAQVAELRRHGMRLFCEQNGYALAHLDDKTIAGWLLGDEPDNAQELPGGKGYGPPIPPAKVLETYQKMKVKDATRPVMLNLGQGVAWDGWYGRGVRTNHPEDYAEYVKAGDIVSFDIYPAVHDRPVVAGKLWYVARGVERLRHWTADQKPVWDCIECTHIGNSKVKPTPAQVKTEVWMSLIGGARGLIYFCHEFQPKFVEAGLLADEEMAKAVGAVNRQIHELAPVILGPTIAGGATVRCEPPDVSPEVAKAVESSPIALVAKKHAGATYVFAVRIEGKPAKATFQVQGLSGQGKVEVLGENRTIAARDGQFADEFGPYGVHLYKIGQSGRIE